MHIVFSLRSVCSMEGWELNTLCRVLEPLGAGSMWDMINERALLVLGGTPHITLLHSQQHPSPWVLHFAEAGSAKGRRFSAGFELSMSSLLGISSFGNFTGCLPAAGTFSSVVQTCSSFSC